MPWHWTQFLRMTCHTGPSGRSTFGRVAPRFCAAAGAAIVAANTAKAASNATAATALSKPGFIGNSSIRLVSSGQFGKAPSAVTEAVPVNAELIEKAQQH